jgi:aspartyl-tRNA(Asn)/glutamyl-tRNA(Gln) amidotransferase subunit A
MTDADALRRLREAGALLIGIHNLDELAYGVTGENEAFGDVRNPHDEARMTGGSSAGSAAAVAGDFCFAALGTDTAGSIRIPAALCGVVGFKPTFGPIPTRGVLPLSPSLDTVGVLAGSVDDVALVFDALVEPEEVDAADERALRAPTIGVVEPSRLGPIDRDVAAGVDAALEAARAAGASLVPVDLPPITEAWRPIFTIVGAEAWARYGSLLDSDPGPGRRVRRSLEAGSQITAAELAAALRERDRLAAMLDSALDGIDALALPTVPIPAPLRGTRKIDDEPIGVALLRLTCPFNLSGQPAISIPCGRTSAGLPIGLQLVSRRYGDRRLLEVALALESALSSSPDQRSQRAKPERGTQPRRSEPERLSGSGRPTGMTPTGTKSSGMPRVPRSASILSGNGVPAKPAASPSSTAARQINSTVIPMSIHQ